MASNRTLAIVRAVAAAAELRVELSRPPDHAMHAPPPRSLRVPIWRRHLGALAALALLAGCATNGDFGEVHPSLVRDDIHDWLGRDVTASTASFPSTFELTDSERQLRDLAYPLIEQPFDRQQPFSVAGEYGVIGSNHRGAFDRTDYANHLFGSRARSPAARYAQITDDIRNDITRLPQFFETATYVLDIDLKRRKSLAYISGLSSSERDNALRRINENASLVSLVRAKLAQRVSAYRFALERMVVMTPSSQAVDVERSLNQLQALITRYRKPAAPWGREQSLASAR